MSKDFIVISLSRLEEGLKKLFEEARNNFHSDSKEEVLELIHELGHELPKETFKHDPKVNVVWNGCLEKIKESVK